MSTLDPLLNEPKIAYFSMEIGLRTDVPTYSGGLGVLAGDTIKTCADLKLPVVGVTLVSRQGYFRQELDADGRQHAKPAPWNPRQVMTLVKSQVRVTIDRRPVVVAAWLYWVESPTGGRVPVLFLDTDLADNAPEHRELTSFLYGRDAAYRLRQEAILGIGGGKMLQALGVTVRKYHMNEGHSALLTLELLERFRRPIESVWHEELVWDVERIKDLCVFTTHTPVDAGHDRFPYDLVERVLGTPLPLAALKRFAGHDMLNMTLLALNLSRFVNGVAKKHGEVSRTLFPGYEISAITNGVHTFTWTCPEMAALYDAHLPGWANDPELLVRVDNIPDDALWAAHQAAKTRLLALVARLTGAAMSPDILTIGFARRMTPYKRADLLFSDIKRLADLGEGRLQIVLAGKAHPQDEPGQRIIQRLVQAIHALRGRVTAVFLPDYDMDMALTVIAGSDLWLNTPRRPHEASGTSGMKATHNGVPNFSVLDGWWIEGHVEGVTGWSIGPPPRESTLTESGDARDAHDLYEKLERVIVPLYRENRREWIAVMKHAIGKNASFFNCHRMMRRYVTEAYLR
ncbi:MAG: alpha-glucan family phosphorylase [Nitrospirae bacterium]|nr:alpha-glucan family phosphorylase [Nitrospirota bacterium]